MIESITRFLRTETAGGALLLMAMFAALLFANSGLSGIYEAFLGLPVEIRVGAFSIAKPLVLWINDGLMAIFFFMIGLELKRELIDGELSDSSQIKLPIIGAIGGMAAPALIYTAFNHHDPVAMQGWAIPTATDIAFALGILSLLGKRVPLPLKIFLVSLAIIDDIGAIIIIALFYTVELSLLSLSVASVCLAILFTMNRRGVATPAPYLLVGLVMWTAVLKSGVHATLAGVALAFFIPYRTRDGRNLAGEIEHDLHPAVAFIILPLFAFANAGVALDANALAKVITPVPLGIAAGLFIGKQMGVFLSCYLAVKLRLAPLPKMRWRELYGVALLCGIGFTMSLFIGSLAFEQTGASQQGVDRLGVLLGSLLSAVAGLLYLHFVLPKAKDQELP